MPERKADVDVIIDPMITGLIAAGREAYRQREELCEIVVPFDDYDGFFVSVGSEDPERVAEELLKEVAALKSYIFADHIPDYSPEECVRAFVRGFGVEASLQGDLRTAISVLTAVVGKDDPMRKDLEKILLTDLSNL